MRRGLNRDRDDLCSSLKSGMSDGSLKTVIAHRFEFEQIAQAHALLEQNDHFGRIVVSVRDRRQRAFTLYKR